MNHEPNQMMRRCIELARQAWGRTSPNPMVGAIVVKDGEIVGEGFHPGAGQPHAEVFALREAKEKAQDSTVYVSLEPCNHFGRTPPCTEALIAARVSKVVIGMVDPDPRVCGSGIEKLRAAGIEVVVGVEEEACRKLNEAFIHRVIQKRPFGILKYAMTLDGKIAATGGHSAWVTTPASRNRVHKLRSVCDAVIVGGNTVRRDNPLLTSHGVSDCATRTGEANRNPLRVVMSGSLDLPEECQLWDTNTASTLVFTKIGSNLDLQQKLKDKGVEIVELLSLTPIAVMENLYKRCLSQVLWECGGVLAAAAIADSTVQKVMAFIAPKIIGGQNAPSAIGDLGLVKMTDALSLKNVSFEAIGSDFLLTGYF
jgi:diaminohydroxyphosphoribosylaminopyrimidine deaminase / 5-amino-6-(5-phosphoribosylamino)uracil reductase